MISRLNRLAGLGFCFDLCLLCLLCLSFPLSPPPYPLVLTLDKENLAMR